MKERRSDRVVSVILSVLIHAAIVGALLWGWWQYRRPQPTPQTLAIEATVVRTPAAAPAQPPPPAAQPVPQPTPPAPDLQAQQKAAKQQAEEAQRAAEAAQKEAADKAAAAQAEQQRQQEAERAEAERQARAKAEQQAKAEADLKAQAEADRKAKAEAERKAQEQAQRQQREADLRSQLDAEEHLNAVQSSPAKAEYLALITARINRAWNRPPSARSGVKCTVHLTQVPGGEITHVTVEGCTGGDDSVRQSVETAAYRASPLPAPADPALFDPNITVTFAPDD